MAKDKIFEIELSLKDMEVVNDALSMYLDYMRSYNFTLGKYPTASPNIENLLKQADDLHSRIDQIIYINTH